MIDRAGNRPKGLSYEFSGGVLLDDDIDSRGEYDYCLQIESNPWEDSDMTDRFKGCIGSCNSTKSRTVVLVMLDGTVEVYPQEMLVKHIPKMRYKHTTSCGECQYKKKSVDVFDWLYFDRAKSWKSAFQT